MEMQTNELSVNLHCFDSFYVENNRFANKLRDSKLFKYLNHDTYQEIVWVSKNTTACLIETLDLCYFVETN